MAFSGHTDTAMSKSKGVRVKCEYDEHFPILYEKLNSISYKKRYDEKVYTTLSKLTKMSLLMI
jgi:hypothetical protein